MMRCYPNPVKKIGQFKKRLTTWNSTTFLIGVRLSDRKKVVFKK